MAEHASDFTPGEMDVHAQQATFHAFIGMTKWGSLTLASVLLFVVLWFCTSIGFFGGLVSGVVVAIAGYAVLKEKPPHVGH